MSRIGKKPISIPAGVTIEVVPGEMRVKGAKGELSRSIDPRINVTVGDGTVSVSASNGEKTTRALWGTSRMHIANMVEGVSSGFTKKLQIEGIGYRASVDGTALVLQVGFTHPVKIEAEPGIAFKVEKNIVTVSGINKDTVSKVAAQVHRVRPPEPYKGKGIRYVGELVRKKVGKKAATGAAGGK